MRTILIECISWADLNISYYNIEKIRKLPNKIHEKKIYIYICRMLANE